MWEVRCVPACLVCLLLYSNFNLLQRVDAARSRIESLNPLVSVETSSDVGSLDWDALVKRCDIVCLTDGSVQDIVSRVHLSISMGLTSCQSFYNELCRKHNTPYYAGGSYGLSGYIFVDLMAHEYIAVYVDIRSDQLTPFRLIFV